MKRQSLDGSRFKQTNTGFTASTTSTSFPKGRTVSTSSTSNSRVAVRHTITPSTTTVRTKRVASATTSAVKKREVKTAEVNNQEEPHDNHAEFGQSMDDDTASTVCDSICDVTPGEHSIITAVRVRPMLASEKKNGYRRIIDMGATNGTWTRIVNPVALPKLSKSSLSSSSSTSVLPPVSSQFTQDFTFDHSFWSYDNQPGRKAATQNVIYEELGLLAIDTAWQGCNCTIFTYGQTSAGKTFTMMGNETERASSTAASTRTSVAPQPSRSSSNSASSSNSRGTAVKRGLTASSTAAAPSNSGQGLIPRICRGLFDKIQEAAAMPKPDGITSSQVCVHVSYVEIYHDRVYDLLVAHTSAKESLKVREHPEDGIYVEHANLVRVTKFADIKALIDEGNRIRSVAATRANDRSSRSHAVLTLFLKQTSSYDSPSVSIDNVTKTSKLCLVDLAGSERVDASAGNGARMREAGSINRSLATLGDVISALSKRSSALRQQQLTSSTAQQHNFIPYRNSMLTRLLKESLGGNAKTIMLAAISPCCIHYEETLNTLKYIERAKSVTHVVRVNTEVTSSDPGYQHVQELQREIFELKAKLDAVVTTKAASPIVIRPVASIESLPVLKHEAEDVITAQASPQQPESPEEPEEPEVPEQNPADVKRPLYNVSISLDEQEKANMEREISELKALLKKKDRDFQLQEQTTKTLNDKVNAQVMRQHAHMINLAAIYRRSQFMDKFCAFNHWKQHIRLSDNMHSQENATIRASCGEYGYPPVLSVAHTSQSLLPISPNSGTSNNRRAGDYTRKVDLLCAAVVEDFFASHTSSISEQQEPLLSSTEDKDAHIDMDTIAIDLESNGDNIFDDSAQNDEHFVDVSFEPNEDLSTMTQTLSLEAQQQRIQGKLSTCLDAIDIARKTMGPTMRKLREISGSTYSTVDVALKIGTAMERQFLIYVEKTFLRMVENLSALKNIMLSPVVASAQKQWCAKNDSMDRLDLYENVEDLLSSFCLQLMGRICDQLVSPSARGIDGLQNQLDMFQGQLKKLIPFVLSDDMAAQFLVLTFMDLIGISERIKAVWSALDQKHRQRLLYSKAQQDSTDQIHKLTIQITELEDRYHSVLQRYESQNVRMAKRDEELQTLLQMQQQLEEEHSSTTASLEYELQLANGRASELESYLGTLTASLEAHSAQVSTLEKQLAQAVRRSNEMADGVSTSTNSADTLKDPNSVGGHSSHYSRIIVKLEEELASALTQFGINNSNIAIQKHNPIHLSHESIDSEYSVSVEPNGFEDLQSAISKMIAGTEQMLSAACTHAFEIEERFVAAVARAHDLEAQCEHLAMNTTYENIETTLALPEMAETRSEESPRTRESEKAEQCRLESTVADLNIRVQMLNEESVVSQAKSQDLERQLAEHIETNVRLYQKLGVAEARTQELETIQAQAASQRSSASAQDDFDQLKEIEFKLRLAIVESELSAAYDEMNEWKRKHLSAVYSLELLNLQNEEREKELMVSKAKTVDLESQFQLLDQRYIDAQTQIAAIHENAQIQATQQIKVKDELVQALFHKDRLEEEVQIFHASCAQYIAKIAFLEDELRSKVDERNNISTRIVQLEQQIADYQVQVEHLEGAQFKLETALTSEESRSAKLSEQLVSVIQKNEELEAVRVQIVQESEIRAKSLEMAEKKIHDLSSQRLLLQERLDLESTKANELEILVHHRNDEMMETRRCLTEEHTSAVAELTHSLDTARQTNKEYKNKLMVLQTQYDTQCAFTDKIEGELCTSLRTMKQLEAESEILRDDCIAMTVESLKETVESAAIVDELHHATAQLLSLQSECAAHCSAIEKLEESLEAAVRDRQGADAINVDLQAKIDAQMQLIVQSEDALASALQQNKCLEHALSMRNHSDAPKIQDLTEELAATQSKVVVLNEKVTELSEICVLKDLDVENMNHDLVQASQRLLDWEAKFIETMDLHERELESIVTRGKEDLEKMTQVTQEWEAKCIMLEDLQRVKNEESSQLRDTIQQLQTALQDLQDQYDCAHSIQAHQTSELEATHASTIYDLESRINEMTIEVHVWGAKYNEKQAEFDEYRLSLEKQTQMLTEAAHEWEKKYEDETQESQNNRIKLSSCETELCELKAKVVELEQSVEEQCANSVALESVIDVLRTQLSEVEEKCSLYLRQMTWKDVFYAELEQCTAKEIRSWTARYEALQEAFTSRNASMDYLLQVYAARSWENESRCEMQLAEFESYKAWKFSEYDILDVQRLSVESRRLATMEAEEDHHLAQEKKRVILKHLKSLDTWFARAIMGQEVDEISGEEVNDNLDYVGKALAPSQDLDEDDLGLTGADEKAVVVELEELGDELLALCSTNEVTPKSAEWVQQSHALSSSSTQLQLKAAELAEPLKIVCTAAQPVRHEQSLDASVDTNDLEEITRKSAQQQRTTASFSHDLHYEDLIRPISEAAHLKSIVLKLKKALDEKEEMIIYLDKQLNYYEDLVPKHQSLEH